LHLNAEGTGSIPVPVQVTSLSTSVKPTNIVLIGKAQAPTQDKVVSEVVVTTTSTTTTDKSWAQVASPAKPDPSQAVRGKEQEPATSHGERSKVVEDHQKKPKEKKEKVKKKIASSSSSSSPPAKKPTKTAKTSRVPETESVGLYRKWIRDWFRAGCDLKAIKKIDLEDDTKRNFYVVWEGRSRGIFLDWDTCFLAVDKYRGAKYKKVSGTIIEALKFFKEHIFSDV